MYKKMVVITVAGFGFILSCAIIGCTTIRSTTMVPATIASAAKENPQQQDMTLVEKSSTTEPVNLDKKEDLKNSEEIVPSEILNEEKYLLADSGPELHQAEVGCNTIELCVSFIKQEILRNWSHQSNYELMKTNIAFVIGDSYELSEIKIIKSSGNALFDSSVLAAVSASSPFLELGELPKSEFERIREISLVFSPPPKKKKVKKKKTVMNTLNVQRSIVQGSLVSAPQTIKTQ